MRLHELKMAKVDRLVYHIPTDRCVVLTPRGDVYINFSTSDPSNLVYAVGGLFDDDWRYATPDELLEWSGVTKKKPYLCLVAKKKPRLYLVT